MKSLITKIKTWLFKPAIVYAFFGALTAVVSIGVFELLLVCGIGYALANLISLLLGKLFAYVTSKLFVFKTHCANFWGLLKEFFRFSVVRGFTMLIDYFGLIIMVEFCSLNKKWSKYFLVLVVVLMNYFLSKHSVFNAKEDNK